MKVVLVVAGALFATCCDAIFIPPFFENLGNYSKYSNIYRNSLLLTETTFSDETWRNENLLLFDGFEVGLDASSFGLPII